MKIIFLDRDGVINEQPTGDTNYVTRPGEFHFLPGAKEALKRLKDAGYEVIVISNQAGVAKGFYSENDLKEITDFMLREVEEAGGRLSAVHYCTHRAEDNCDCRKPEIGLFKKALEELEKGEDAMLKQPILLLTGIKLFKKLFKRRSLNLSRIYFIGDQSVDIEAARNLRCRSILLLTGWENKDSIEGLKVKPDYVAQGLLDAVTRIVLKKEKKGREK